MTAAELFRSGQLQTAITAATAEVRQQPTNTAARGLLCELLCFARELERADAQLDALSYQDPALSVGVALFRQLIRAEQARQDFFASGRLPDFLEQPTPMLRTVLEASIYLREGKPAEAAQLLAQAEAQRPHPSGTCDGRPFTDFRDLDDLTAGVFEVLTSTGKYYWVPIERVETIEFRAPGRPRDLLWRRAHMVVREGGPDGEVYLPVLYVGSHAESDEQLRLGRASDWRAGPPTRGVGQRTFLVGDEAVAILDMKELTFAGTPG